MAKNIPNRPRRFLLLLLVPLVLFVAYQFARHYVQYNTLKAEEAQLQQQLADLQYESALLDDELANAGSDSFIERMARELLGWIKPGEEKFVQDGVSATPSPSPAP